MAEQVWAYFKKYVPEEERKYAAQAILHLFNTYDCYDWRDDKPFCEGSNIVKDAQIL